MIKIETQDIHNEPREEFASLFLQSQDNETRLLSYKDHLDESPDISSHTPEFGGWNSNPSRCDYTSHEIPLASPSEDSFARGSPIHRKVETVQNASYPSYIMSSSAFSPIRTDQFAMSRLPDNNSAPLPLPFAPPAHLPYQQYQFLYQQYHSQYQQLMQLHQLQMQQIHQKLSALNQKFSAFQTPQASQSFFQYHNSFSLMKSDDELAALPHLQCSAPNSRSSSPHLSTPCDSNAISRKASYDDTSCVLGEDVFSITHSHSQSSPSPDEFDVTPYIMMSQEEASKKIGIPSSTLSKRWRESTNNRKWPFRQINKIDREIKNIMGSITSSTDISPSQQECLALLLKQRQQEASPVYIKKGIRP